MEYRGKMSAFVRTYAVNQFMKTFQQTKKNVELQKLVLQNVKAVSEVYRPHRLYKKKNISPVDLHSRVQITLLEYGLDGDIYQKIKLGSSGNIPQFTEDDIIKQVWQLLC